MNMSEMSDQKPKKTYLRIKFQTKNFRWEKIFSTRNKHIFNLNRYIKFANKTNKD